MVLPTQYVASEAAGATTFRLRFICSGSTKSDKSAVTDCEDFVKINIEEIEPIQGFEEVLYIAEILNDTSIKEFI